ncbi:MAG: S8 family serine peptidase [Solirubrobacterales bacterium]|nr:S8 family serine peptidase [Solirubrobacterales bacterium]
MTNVTPRKIIPALTLLLALACGSLAVVSGGAANAAVSPDDGTATGLTGTVTEATAPHGVGQTEGGAEYARGEVLVTLAGESEPKTLEIPPASDPERVADLLEEKSAVRDASPNFIARISGWRPDDPGVNPGRRGRAGGWMERQWNFLPCGNFCHPKTAATGPRSRGGMNVLRAWQHLRKAGRPGASGVRIAVLDTGIAYRNLKPGFRRDPDLSPNRFLPGYDFVRKNRLPLDRNGHGTHIASTIAQTTNNRMGMTGIAYRAKILPVRVMDSGGHGSTANIIAGIRWAADHGARVITMSLNFGCGARIPALESAIRYAYRKGAVLVGSSGNRSAQDCPSLPATSPRVISVGGTTEAGCVGTYSFRSSKVDLAAPGGGRGYSDCPYKARNRSIMQVGMIAGIPDWFGIESGWVGTSMAAAHVAGAAAAVIASRSLTGKRGPAQVIRRLTGTARLPAWARGDRASGYGAGIVDLGRAVNPAVKAG